MSPTKPGLRLSTAYGMTTVKRAFYDHVRVVVYSRRRPVTRMRAAEEIVYGDKGMGLRVGESLERDLVRTRRM